MNDLYPRLRNVMHLLFALFYVVIAVVNIEFEVDLMMFRCKCTMTGM